jgi:hypothetical protein
LTHHAHNVQLIVTCPDCKAKLLEYVKLSSPQAHAEIVKVIPLSENAPGGLSR